MTRHNLNSHISWLLSRKITPPSGVHAAAPTRSIREDPVDEDLAGEEEEELDQDVSRAPPSPPQHRGAAQVVNVAEAFARPALPALVTAKPQLHQSRQTITDEAMGKLSSASRSTRPGLMSQHQLATPASTTSSTAASHISFTSNYNAFAKTEGQDSPSSRPAASRNLPPQIQRSLQTQTPRTPRQTPRPTPGPDLQTIESVDLSNDDKGGIRGPGSSSSVEIWGDSSTVWREDSASRAEPLPSRSSRKRKSTEMSPGRPQRTESYERQRARIRREQNTSTEGFVDIDDIVPSQSTRTPIQKSRNSAMQASIEQSLDRNDIEEIQVTETISRVETRTRKSISRVSSATDEFSVRPQGGGFKHLPPSGSPTMSPRSSVQVAASPLRRAKSPVGFSPQTPHKTSKCRTRTVIEDSEDDDCYSDPDQRASFFPPKAASRSTSRPAEPQSSPRMKGVPTLENPDGRARDYRISNPRTGSPLRPISRNISVRPEAVSSPLRRESPSKPTFVKLVHPPSGQNTPGSSLGIDDRKLAMLYLNKPSELNKQQEQATYDLSQNALRSMSYLDKGEAPPAQLKPERIALLDMVKAYTSLSELAERWRILMEEKKELARQVYELLDRNADTSQQEERQASVNQDIKTIEQQVAKNLHLSGAIIAGFGSRPKQDADNQIEQTQGNENVVPLPSGTSTFGSTQVIMQTQFPSLQQSSITASDSRFSKDRPSQTNAIFQPAVSSNVFLPPPSPSPVRRSVPAPSVMVSQPAVAPKIWPSPAKFKQPNFYQELHPLEFDDLDDEDFNDLIEAEQIHQGHSRPQEEVPDDIEDDYGNSDDDNDFVKWAQAVEKHQTLPAVRSNQSKYAAVSDTAATLPVTSKSTQGANDTTMYSHIDLSQSSMFNHRWSQDVKKALRERFRLKGFRRHQIDAINATLGGQDVFVLMPTGGGKSLCYQLPAIVKTGITRGVTIVISPLLSLMNDQVQHLRAVNVQAASLNSDTPLEEKRKIYRSLKEEIPELHIELLYITPEMVNKSTVMINALTRLYKNKKLARIVIDEAHCVSQWGHDFRPDYVALGRVREQFPNVPLMALTATATKNVKDDIKLNLKMHKNCPVFTQSFNRPNLHYEVRLKKGKGILSKMVLEIADLVKDKYKNQTGIIYALSQKGCEELAEKLVSNHNIKAYHFHAGMTREEKATVLDDWQKGNIQVVVATIAFGMGIDKPDVRFVIHSSVPKSLEGYYQETGRAGRDGKKSGCYLYFGYQDISMLKGFIDKSEGSEEQKQRQRSMLQQMILYCENQSDCRRSQVLSYFGETFAKKDCRRTCDNCCSDAAFKEMDFTDYAKAAMRVVTHVQDYNFTMLNCVEVLRGTAGARAKLNKMDGGGNIAETGYASQVARGEVERLFYRLLLEKAITEVGVMNRSGFSTDYVKLGPKCRDYMNGKKKVMLTVQVSGTTPTQQKSQGTGKYPTSTMLTSPISAVSRRQIPFNQPSKVAGYEQDGFVVSDGDDDYEEEAFESMQGPARHRQASSANSFSGPITTDRRMEGLDDCHREVVSHFVQQAKALEEKMRNKAGARKAFFSEANFRDMAIDFTTSLDAMRRIPGIKVDRVDAYGKSFLPLIRQMQESYAEMMRGGPAQDQDADMDSNHQNVIDLVTDEEDGDEDDDEDDGQDSENHELTPSEEAAARIAERSPFFPGTSITSFSRYGPAKSKVTGQSRTGGSFRGRGKGKGGTKRYKPRTSNGSASGQSTSGISKKSWPGPKKSRARKTSGLRFNQQSGRGGGGSGGMGIGMMPT
ncbi:hypothetical protein VTL71DRAFT_4048 [Oculimacula yallundae]|uniref:DNA 3'-5' helicase n=1 Tax=Oculimacula yallundae TaxID=86028 RepID=A0ABR4C4Q0_9HELO